MKKEFLSRLYYACSDESSYYESGDNLGELYQRIADVDTADHLFSDKLGSAKLSADDRETLENCFNVACWSYEQQGFINGFRLGLMLARELGL